MAKRLQNLASQNWAKFLADFMWKHAQPIKRTLHGIGHKKATEVSFITNIPGTVRIREKSCLQRFKRIFTLRQ